MSKTRTALKIGAAGTATVLYAGATYKAYHDTAKVPGTEPRKVLLASISMTALVWTAALA